MKAWFDFFRKGSKPVGLVWRSQYLSRDPEKDGTTIIHFARSNLGVFEIYDDGSDFLLSYPPQVKMPADVFSTLELAKGKAAEIHKLKYDKN